MPYADKVTLVEVGPRDGLQAENRIVPAYVKLALIHRLSDTGLPVIEATGFVSPKWIPQLADAEEIMQKLERHEGVRYPVLVPNMIGLERALSVGVEEIAVFTAASEAFNQKNINCSIDESLQRFEPVMQAARDKGLRVRGYISTVLGCPYQGEVSLADVVRVAEALLDLGVDEISLGDTIGVGTADKARNLIRTVSESVPVDKLAVHFHDTYGQALANILASLEAGIRTVDASVAGLGGCPYARGATGNVATEDVVYLLDGLGMETGVDIDRLANIGHFISEALGRSNQSRAGVAIH